MNKHCYRLRFHHRTAQLIPVAEIHTASSRGGTRRSRPRRGLAALPLAGLLLASPAPAQIVPADNQASTVTIAPNGVPVINIAAPDASGLSHNRFSHLNVTPPGAVFNNSKLDGRSQLAGYILKNPRLGSGPQAASILAEVTSPGPASRLGGTLEVFGRPGQLIIANPNGISVNGLSTLNIHALTLSTGSTQGADAWSLHTRQGRIDIDSDGVNTDGLSSFDLIARYINIHGPIGPLRSGAPARLGLHAGASRHDLKDGQTLPQPSTASARPAISASALGAMHGAHIRLEVTDSGAGVRLQGALLSSSDITIHANGAVLLANSTARRDTLVTAGSDVHLAEAGGILTGQALKITTSGQIQTGGKIQAGTLQVQAASLSQTAGLIDVQGGPGQLAAMITLKNAYQVGAAPAGLQVRRGNARIQAATLDNRGLITTTDGDLKLKIADTLLNRGRIDTGGLLTLSTQGSLNNAGRLQSGILELHAGSLQQTGHLETQADGHITVTTDLSNPGRIAFGGQGNIQARTLSNSGTLQAGKHLRVSSDALANSGGLSGKDLSLATTGVFSNTGQIQAGGDLDIEAADYRNSAHIAGKRLRVQTGTELVLDNHAPLATERLILAAPKIVVRAELASPASLVLQSDGGIDNHAAIASAGSVQLQTQGDIHNHDGALIWAGDRLGLRGRSIFNGLHGLIHSEADMSIQASRLLRNDAGRINSRQAMSLETPLLENFSRLSGKVSIDSHQGGQAWFPVVKKPYNLRTVSMQIGEVQTGRIVSSLHLEQGVIHAGKNMDIKRPGDGPGEVHNAGRLTADGLQRIHANIRNASLSQAMTLADYFRQIPGPQVWAQDNLAVLNPLTQPFPTLYDLLDHMFDHYEYAKDAGWSTIFVAYKYKHSWLSDSLAGGNLERAPVLAKALGRALGGDWRGLSDTDRARRWAEFKAGDRGQDLPFYPDQQTVLGGRLGTDIKGKVVNGEHVADVLANPVDAALQQAVAEAQKHWKRGQPTAPGTPEPGKPTEKDAGRPDNEAKRQALTEPARKKETKEEERARKQAESDAQQLAGGRRQAYYEGHDRDFQRALDDTLSNTFLFRRAQGQPTRMPTPYYETRVRFVDQTQFYGSSYFFEKVGYTPRQGIYVSGDNYFDSTLIRREAERLMSAQTQRRVYQEGGMVRQLMDNASAVHAALGLVVGQAPSKAQLAQLRDDIVWYVWHDIDGRRVLMPKVYLSEATIQATATQKAAGGAAIVSAGNVKIHGESFDQKNALIEGGKVRLDARDDIKIVNSHGILGGLRADQQLTARARDIYVKGGVLSGKDVELDARRNLTIIVGQKSDAAGSARKDEASLIQAAGQLALRAGGQINTLGAKLAGQTVVLAARQVNLGEIREHSGEFKQESRTGFLSQSIDTWTSTLDQGKGTTVQAGKLQLDVQGDMAMMGGHIQARRTEGKIGGHLVLAATAEHRNTRQEHDSFQLVANGRAGAGGKEASFSVGTLSPVHTQAGDGQMSGAELKTGLQIDHRTATQRTTRHQNVTFNLGDGRLDVGGVFDLGGGDINADRAQASAAHSGTLDISAARIESSKYLDSSEQLEESWSLFVGNKSNANSSILDVATHAGVAAQQAAEGREIDPLLMAAQVAGDVTNLVLNDTGELSTGVGAEFNYNRSSRHRTAENTSKIGGSIRLLSTQGDINLVGVQFSGGARVDLESAGSITMRAAKATETSFGEQHNVSAYLNATASCNAVQASCGAGGNVALAGSHSVDKGDSVEHVHGHLQAREVRVTARKDLNLIGARIDAAQDADIAVGGKLRVQTVQDTQRSSTNGGNWNLSLGAAVNNRTIGTLTGNIGATVRHEHDNAARSTQIAGIGVGNRLGMTVKGDAELIGGAITARGPGSRVDIRGKLAVSEVKDYRDHDGGYFGGSIGISASTSLPSGSISGGRIAGERQASTLHGTIDIGQGTGQGKLQVGGGVSGELNQDAGKVRSIEEDRKWAQNDISITISKLDAGGKKARQKREQGRLDGLLATDFKGGKLGHVSTPLAAATPQADDVGVTRAPADRRARSLPTTTSQPRVDAAASGAAAPEGMSGQLQSVLPGLTVKGYKGGIDVTPQGRKIPVDTGGLGRSDSSSSSHRYDGSSDLSDSASDGDDAFNAFLASQRQARQRANVVSQTLDIMPDLEPARVGQYADNYLAMTGSPQTQALSVREAVALMHYTQTSEVNAALRGLAPLAPVRGLVSAIDSATNKLIDAGFTNQGMLHRGQRAAPLEQVPEGGIYREPALMSTSENVQTAREYLKPQEGTPALLHIAGQGARITALAGLDDPLFDSIQEVLIPRQTPLRLRLKAQDGQGVLRAVLEDAQAQSRPDSGMVDALVDWPLRSPEGPRLPAAQPPRRHSMDAPDLATLLAFQSVQADPQAESAAHAGLKRQASDPGEGPAPKEGRNDPYGKRTIVLAGDDAHTRQAAERLAGKHPDNSELQQWLPSGEKMVLRAAPQTTVGPEKIQIVGHGGRSAGMPMIGDHTADQLAKALARAPLPPGSKITLVSCDSGACPGQDASSQLQRLLSQTQVKGYAGRIDVNPQGRKQAVTTGGLQGTGAASGGSTTASAELITARGVAISHTPDARQLVVVGHGGWKEKTREKTFLRRQQGDGYFELPARTRLDFYTPDGEAAKGTSAYDEIRRRPQDAALGLQPKLPLDDDTLGQLAASRNTSLETIKAEMLRYAVGRMDSIEGAQQAKNYAVYPHEEMGLAFLKQHHQDGGNPLLDLAIVTDPRHKVHLSTILEVAAKAGHQYDVVHYTPCRVCRDGKAKATDFALGAPVPAAASTPSGDAPAPKARRADRDGQGTVVPAGSGHTAAQETPSRAAGSPQAAVAAPSKRYDFRIVGYQEDDARGAEAARRLFGKHPDNAMLVRFDQEGDFTVAQRSPETPAGEAKLQLVGHHRDGLGPNLGGANGRLLAEQVKALDHAYGGRLEFGKITLVGCNTGACPDSGLHEAFRHSLPHALRHRTVGYDGLIDVTPDGRKVSVTEGGLGPKRLPARATAAAAPSPAAPSAAPSAARTRPAAGARPAATGARPPATGARPKNAKAASKSAMAQAPADVLAGYLADPSNKRRFDFVLSDQMSTLDLSDHPYYRVEGMHTIKTQDKGPEHHYVNTFTPETWTLLPPSQRPRHETRYNTADVILSQYLTAARADGFEDQRPGKLVFMLDSQDRTAPFRNADGEVNSERFLSGTRAGRQAQRLMDALDLTIDRIQFNPLIDRLDLHVSTLPGASTTDILSRHLAQPERRQAMDLLQQAFITQRQDRGGAAGSVGGTYALSDLPPDQPINLFVNSFSPDRWIMHQNWRQNAQRPYFANDVVLAQYSIAAKAHGYYGRLPRTIVRDNIVNETSQAFFAAAGARPDLQGFLTKTPNGKHTQRILDSLDMRATGLQWLPEDRQAIITVQPKVEPAKPRAEPARPKAPPAKATSRRPTAGH